jgi:hypothetical protein
MLLWEKNHLLVSGFTTRNTRYKIFLKSNTGTEWWNGWLLSARVLCLFLRGAYVTEKAETSGSCHSLGELEKSRASVGSLYNYCRTYEYVSAGTSTVVEKHGRGRVS